MTNSDNGPIICTDYAQASCQDQQDSIYEICTLLSSFGQKKDGPKVLNSVSFRLFGTFFFPQFFDNSVRAPFMLFSQEGLWYFKIT